MLPEGGHDANMCSESLSGSRSIPHSQVARSHWNQPAGFVKEERQDSAYFLSEAIWRIYIVLNLNLKDKTKGHEQETEEP